MPRWLLDALSTCSGIFTRIGEADGRTPLACRIPRTMTGRWSCCGSTTRSSLPQRPSRGPGCVRSRRLQRGSRPRPLAQHSRCIWERGRVRSLKGPSFHALYSFRFPVQSSIRGLYRKQCATLGIHRLAHHASTIAIGAELTACSNDANLGNTCRLWHRRGSWAGWWAAASGAPARACSPRWTTWPRPSSATTRRSRVPCGTRASCRCPGPPACSATFRCCGLWLAVPAAAGPCSCRVGCLHAHIIGPESCRHACVADHLTALVMSWHVQGGPQ